MTKIKYRVWRLWWYWLRWPMPLWRIKGATTATIGGHRFRFVDIRPVHYLEWLSSVRENRWEPAVVQHLQTHATPGAIVFDVGTYVGGYTQLASRLVGPAGRVYAFEPDPVARGRLEANLRANEVANVTVVPVAISDHEGEVRFSGTGDSTSRIGTDGFSVRTTTLDAFCHEQSVEPAVVKIDIEGAEAQAVTPDACLHTFRVARAVVIEVHEHRGARLEPITQVADLANKRWTYLDQRRAENYQVVLG